MLRKLLLSVVPVGAIVAAVLAFSSSSATAVSMNQVQMDSDSDSVAQSMPGEKLSAKATSSTSRGYYRTRGYRYYRTYPYRSYSNPYYR